MDDHLDLIEVYNPTKEDFTVNWDKIPHTIRSGESKLLQRFLADHYCKHLTDREIQREDAKHVDKDGKKMKASLNNELLREMWRNKIIVGTYQKWEQDRPLTEGEKVARQSELLNERQDLKKLKDEPSNDSGKTVSGRGVQGKRKPGRPKKETATGTPK